MHFRVCRFYFRDVLKILNDKCEIFDTSNYIAGGDDAPTLLAWETWLATAFTWTIVYLCIRKSVKSLSYVVWIAVPLPCIFIVCMIINGLMLENSDVGIRIYLKGEGGKTAGMTAVEKLSRPQIWTEACS